MTENVELMREARAALQGKWGTAAIGTLIYVAIVGGCSAIPFLGGIASLVLGGPLTLGYILFIISIKNNADGPKIETIFDGFQDFGRSLITYVLMAIFVCLWMLLLIVPGIIMSIAYSMTFYIIAEDKTISPYEAIKKSVKMMNGYKWKFFCLSLRFIGWAILAMFTFGIGFLWLQPYMQLSFYNFYQDIKGNNEIPVERIEIIEEN